MSNKKSESKELNIADIKLALSSFHDGLKQEIQGDKVYAGEADELLDDVKNLHSVVIAYENSGKKDAEKEAEIMTELLGIVAMFKDIQDGMHEDGYDESYTLDKVQPINDDEV
jgi:hypothetical protein